MSFLGRLFSGKLQKIVIFQNYNRYYSSFSNALDSSTSGSDTSDTDTSDAYISDADTSDSAPNMIRTLSRAAAVSSLKLESFSVSFLVDAQYFFSASKASWKWPKMTSLILTSRLLGPDTPRTDIDGVLISAAATALNMPKLKNMEIWNGEAQVASLFKYQPSGGQMYASISWRSTWWFALRPPVIRAWEAVANKYGGRKLTINMEILDVDPFTDIKSHGDAIHYLKLSQPVVRPVSLQQIRTEHNIHHMWEERKR